MESLYLLLPLSVLLVLALIGLIGWAVHSGQFDDLEREGQRVLEDEQQLTAIPPLDAPTPAD
jgi:cbb3-type cytochrome oxidase maturation protein